MDSIISVGIDIGTTTTNMVVSRLVFGNISGSAMIPDVTITDKKIIYKSRVYMTPLTDQYHLDGDAITRIVQDEYARAGIKAEDVGSGAVIITGESLLKENAREISDKLSFLAGDFVVATAGPDLESIISGRGAGAETYSKENNCTVANFDIGGGTTNIAVFRCGKLVGKSCLDIGGRLIKYDDDKVLTYISPRLAELLKDQIEDVLTVGKTVMTYTILRKIADVMTETITQLIEGKSADQVTIAMTKGSSMPEGIDDADVISFSGGVSDCIYGQSDDRYKFNDIGVILAESIKEIRLMKERRVIKASETIRATVVGAGVHLIEVSGSTILYSDEHFPLKNVPVLIVSIDAEHGAYKRHSGLLREEITWFADQVGSEKMLLFFNGRERITYDELCNMAMCLARCADEMNDASCPLIVLTYSDMAKSLGQAVKRYMKKPREIICMDSIKVSEGDYVDIGSPIMNGMTLPVVVKTLIFG